MLSCTGGNWRKKLTYLLSIVLLLSGVFACNVLGEPEYMQDGHDPEPGDLLVLFIGSSYFAAHDMPGLFERFAEDAGKAAYVRRDVISGNYLDYFAQSGVTEQVIQEQDWDYVVLQGGCQNAAYPDAHHEITPSSGFHPVFPALESLQAKVEANHSATRLIYMMPWAFEDGMTWVEGMADTYLDMQRKIHDNALTWTDSLGILLAPVGWAWREVLSEEQPQHFLHQSDWNHPSFRGSYLSTAVVYSTIFTESAETVTYYAGLQVNEAQWFLSVASSTVLDNLDLWNLGTAQ
jgi:hypothetical protein